MSADTILAQELVTLAFCWRLERRDGVAIGLTSHDRDLVIGGIIYEAAPGLVPSAIRRGTGLEPESMDLKGAITSDAISEADLNAGKWDGAALYLYLTEWTEPGTLWLELMRGELGTVQQQDESFSAELAGPVSVLGRPVAPETSPGCRALLGDKACRIDMAHHRRVVTIASTADEVVAVSGGGLVNGDYLFGTLRWLEGANCGLTQSIVANDAGSVTLADVPAFAVTAGTRALLTEGCDKLMATCSGRFANAANFRGEPYLPGSDLLTRYPGAT
ncbi:MAG: DUF2163 domain-containing protein [Sphingobium sp.]|nr:DUF2163 domain-containing protein [Sphingobium sp.]MCP5398305.1 DUF2163 domain-containing protein [Sphingomonas sp.]